MCAKYLGFVLLVWFPGVLHAQSAPQSCSAPILNGGYLVPEQEEYSHETMLSYGCEKGLKPAAEGWWSTSTCQDGTWSPRPECIDKEACLPPHIPNAKDRENESGWYADGSTISIKCNEGYGAGSQEATCEKGVWSSVLVCEKSFTSCDAPPKIPHAVIITQGYQEVFAANSQLEYECEDGFSIQGNALQKLITCRNGNWSTLPTCNAAEVEKAVEPATSDDRNPARGGSSANSGMNDRDGSLNAPITTCGDVPVVPSAVVMEEKRTFVRYRCNAFYTQVGPELVYCNSNGRWTQLPTCKERERFCEVDLARYDKIQAISVERITDGHWMIFPCIWPGYFSRFECRNEQIHYTQCYPQ